MCLFFKSLKTEDVFNYYKETVPNWMIAGYPLPSKRNAENFFISPYNVLKKDSCVFSMKVNNNGWRLDFSCYYDKKLKEVHANVWFMNLTLFESAQLQNAIRQTFKKFAFSFMPSATVVFKPKKVCKKLSQVKEYMEEWVKEWNESGIFNFMCNFKKNEELKK